MPTSSSWSLNNPMAKPKRIRIKRGSSTVNVYPTPTGRHMAWTISYHFAGRRTRVKKSRKADALELAAEVANSLNNADTVGLKVTEADAAAFARAKDILASTGKAIELAVAEYVEATTLIGSIPLVEAARFYATSHPKGLKPIEMAQLVSEMVTAKKADGLSARWLRDLKHRLGRFAEEFKGPLIKVDGRAIDTWIRSLNLSMRSRKNYRTALHTLVSYAKKRGYLPREWHQLDAVADPKLTTGKIEIFTPHELELVLEAAPDNFRPFLVIAAFAGIRGAELERMTWADVNWEKSFFNLRADITKTGRKRQVPMLPNLRQWLRPYLQAHGPVCPISNYPNAITKLVAQVGVSWKRNGLRHSFISYRVAATDNEAQVALEAGNSVAMIHKNYLELVSKSDAEAWFAIAPKDKDQEILKLKFK